MRENDLPAAAVAVTCTMPASRCGTAGLPRDGALSSTHTDTVISGVLITTVALARCSVWQKRDDAEHWTSGAGAGGEGEGGEGGAFFMIQVDQPGPGAPAVLVRVSVNSWPVNPDPHARLYEKATHPLVPQHRRASSVGQAVTLLHVNFGTIWCF